MLDCNSKEELIKYVGVDKYRYDRCDFEKLMFNKYHAKKLNSREELRPYYKRNPQMICELDEDIDFYTDGAITSDNYDLYLIDNKEIIDKYFYIKEGRIVNFCEVYIEYNEKNEIIMTYFVSPSGHISLEIQYFLEERFRHPNLLVGDPRIHHCK